MRQDRITKIKYNDNDNIPEGTLKTRITNDKRLLISNLNHGHACDSWYDNRFIGDSYAVFSLSSTGLAQQVSRWYTKIGWAVKFMNSYK